MAAEVLSLQKIRRADPNDPADVLRELEETRALCRTLDDIIEYNPDGIYVTDGDANAIRINPAFERISGLDREKMLGVNHRDLEKNKVVAKSSALMVVERKEEVTIIHEYLATGLQALVTSRPVFDAEGKMRLIVSSTRDVTELYDVRGKLEEERAQRKRTEVVLEHYQSQMLADTPIIAVDKKMRAVLYMASRIAQVDSTVLITGETGAGKEGIAKYIHASSPRKNHPYITINCGAIPESLVESELFGYEKGAFTGALSSGKPGIFELAEHGTVFLDEVGELPMETQAKLLRALETRRITRVGGTRQKEIDVRILSATNRNLPEMIAEKKFREDLYYRLNVVQVRVPPLRERRDDIIPLITHFLDEINARYGFRKHFTNEAYKTMLQYAWPGNVRELKNIVERMAVTSEKDGIGVEDLLFRNPDSVAETRMKGASLKETLEYTEYRLMMEAYQKGGNVRAAAASLQMPVSTYVRRRKALAEKFDREP